MKTYDVIVIGAGVGLGLAFRAEAAKLKVALIDKGNVGGTCVNVGCVPSKMLIYAADRIADIEEAGKLGIEAAVNRVDFPTIMDRMKATINESRTWMRNEVEGSEGMDFYNEAALFVDDHTLAVGKETIKGQKIFIVSGARPLVPADQGPRQGPLSDQRKSPRPQAEAGEPHRHRWGVHRCGIRPFLCGRGNEGRRCPAGAAAHRQ